MISQASISFLSSINPPLLLRCQQRNATVVKLSQLLFVHTPFFARLDIGSPPFSQQASFPCNCSPQKYFCTPLKNIFIYVIIWLHGKTQARSPGAGHHLPCLCIVLQMPSIFLCSSGITPCHIMLHRQFQPPDQVRIS